MAGIGELGPDRRGTGGPVDWPARWLAKFTVYHHRRFGPDARVEPAQGQEFVRFIADRWQALKTVKL